MSEKRVSRREAIGAGIAAGLYASAQAAIGAPQRENKKWLGGWVLEKVYLTAAEVIAPRQPEGAPRRFVILDEGSYAVKEIAGAELELLDASGFMVRRETEAFVLASEAPDFFTDQLKTDPKDRYALLSRGRARKLLGEMEKAVKDFTEFLELHPMDVGSLPDRWEVLVERGLTFAEQGKFEKALADLDEATKDPRARVYGLMNRGYAYLLMGEYEKALSDCDRAIDAGYAHLLVKNNKAWLLAACPDPSLRKADKAIELARAVCEASSNREGMYLDTLAAAYAGAGEFEEAVKTQDKAMEDPSFATRFGDDGRSRRKLYAEKKPYRIKPLKK